MSLSAVKDSLATLTDEEMDDFIDYIISLRPQRFQDPLEILERIANTSEDDKAVVAAARTLAEYRHQKLPHKGHGEGTQDVNIVMLLGEGKNGQSQH